MTRNPFLVVLGVAQDAGVPHAGCFRPCCAGPAADPVRRRLVASLGIVVPAEGRAWILDATPDLDAQLRFLTQVRESGAYLPDGIFLTHAHTGHYAGLMILGREGLNARAVPVHALPRMEGFLRANGPWSQLVTLGNIDVRPLTPDVPVELAGGVSLVPFLVPHRGEFSETCGFRIRGPRRTAVYLPDLDGWEALAAEGLTLEDLVASADLCFLDATFHDENEIPGRAGAEIPHPPVTQTLSLLSALHPAQREKVCLIHLNHTNPLLNAASEARRAVRAQGVRVAVEGETMDL